MNVRKVAVTTVLAGAAVASLLATRSWGQARSQVNVGKEDIGGVVTSSKGPEAGVWVIAETKDLPTKFAKIVVTDDEGRYLIPGLPAANYEVFVRGYGLVDSQRQNAKPGAHLDLKAEVAPDAKSAAQVYPAAWWLSMLQMPDDNEFKKKFTMDVKECYDCHQLGNHITRTIGPKSAPGATSTLDAWERRTKVGPSGPSMGQFFLAIGDHRKMFADWSDRIAKGEVPKIAPPRPTGVERNLVISEWDWGTPKDGRSDAAASDTLNPRVNANGIVYGASEMTDGIAMLDPVKNVATRMSVASEAPVIVSGFNASPTPSIYWGPDTWKRSGDPRSVMIDGKGRMWVAIRERENRKQPEFCGPEGNKFGKFYPLRQSGRQFSMYDPKTRDWEHIDTCFSADHNELGKDNNVYFGVGSAVAWIDINTWDKTHDASASQGWCPGIIDTNGDGKITPGWSEPNDPVDPTRDHRINFGAYSIAVSPTDGSLWVSGIGRGDKRLVRITKGSNPPETCHTEFFEPPPNQTVEIFGSGGVVADEQGVIWQGWRASGHLTSFDRRKCKTTSDPMLTGQSCPEGWTVYRSPNVPTYTNSPFLADEAYLMHMDNFDVLGLGKDAPMYGSMNTDSFQLLTPKDKKWVTLRVPYPLGFFPRSANARIDDPKAGWKGKGIWADYGSYVKWHIEGGPGTLPKAVKFQMRPDPLAR